MKRVLVLCAAILMLALPVAAKDLMIYFIDVEGGQATLIVSPSGESMLVDAGWPGYEGRDADRIVAAAKRAGISQIDYMLMTHYHLDHVGGILPLAQKIPIRTFVDHGDNTETGAQAERLSEAYYKLRAGGKHLIVKPGDTIPLRGVSVRVIAARGETLSEALPGAGQPTPGCAETREKAPDASENARSIAFMLTYGKFRFADLADLTWNKELALVCPDNPIGTADLYLVTHHGMNISNAPPILNALHPLVAISNNGAKKGGSPEALARIRNTPGLQDFWQLHTANAAGGANTAEQFIANPDPECQGHSIDVEARQDGSFTVINTRNNLTRTYSR